MKSVVRNTSACVEAPILIAWSMILQIFRAYVSESEPPKTAKSWE